ncbi:hypothetical protein ACLGIH_01070 [Streptomyces sp. HMX87]|uniref:hypothetical protein n=1 Tax=Streptomyces sp. HMX87 TaxID=3390849 RepID=UPI003A8B8EBE
MDHPAEIRDLAAELGTPLVGLTALTTARVEELDPEPSKAVHLTAGKRDDTHTSVRDVTEYAGFIVRALRAQRLLSKRVVR